MLYTAENAQDVRAAVVEAAAQKAYLGGADLRGAYLGGAYLGGAYLGGADLGGAYLGGADLGGAYLDPQHPFFAIRLDVWSILDQAPAEVAGLRTALVEGRIDGSTYSGECACLVGTIANVRGLDVDAMDDIVQDSSRPAEQWFIAIRKGDRPLTKGTEEAEPSEGVFRATVALRWLDEWVESRSAIAAALAGARVA